MSQKEYIECIRCTSTAPTRDDAVLYGWHVRDGVWSCDACFNGTPSEPGVGSVKSPPRKG